MTDYGAAEAEVRPTRIEDRLTVTAVHALRYTRLHSRWSKEFLLWDWYDAEDGESTADFSTWVIRTADGPVLFDTGFTQDAAAARGQTILHDVLTGLREAGVEPTAVRTIVLSHLHYDHCGNLEHFPNARIHVQRAEWEFWTGPIADRALFRTLKQGAYLDILRAADAEGRLVLLDGDTEVAPGITAVMLGGHTVGSQVLRVEASGRPIVLAGDAAHYDLELENDWPFFIVADVPAMYRGFDRLREWAAAGDRVIAGHDPKPAHTLPAVTLPSGALLVDLTA